MIAGKEEDEMSRFAICAEHFVKPGAMDRWLRLAKANSTASLNEPECYRFDIALDRHDPNHAFLYEIYESRAAWLSHCEQPHFKTFVDGVQELLVKRVRSELDLAT
jgi:(4S)-4-hydroxy-5-phosphonooxypentane-2,3-dione isomerase